MYTTSSFKLVQLAVAAALLFMLASCGVAKRNYREMIYFQNAKQVNTPVRLQLKPTVIQKYDQLMIQVYAQSINQEQAALFNMTSGMGQNGVVNVQQGNTLAGYIVDYEGNIDFPIIGKVKAIRILAGIELGSRRIFDKNIFSLIMSFYYNIT